MNSSKYVYTFGVGSSGNLSFSTVVILFCFNDRSGDCIRVRISAQDSRDQEGGNVFPSMKTDGSRFCHQHRGTVCFRTISTLYQVTLWWAIFRSR